MKKLTPIEKDNKILYQQISEHKRNKRNTNSHCKACTKDKSACVSCEYTPRKRLEKIEDKVFDRYDYYQQNIQKLDQIKPLPLFSDDDKKLLISIYENDTVFDKAKEEIDKVLNDSRECPFCMLETVHTYDHYYPKEDYPEFAFYTYNLVPCCYGCNSYKGKRLYGDNGRLFLHFYYDEIPEDSFLSADISITDNKCKVKYNMDTTALQSVGEIINNHFIKLHLLDRYLESSNEQLSELHDELAAWYKNGADIDMCIKIIETRIQVKQKKKGNNYWQACLFEGLIRDKDVLRQFIEIQV